MSVSGRECLLIKLTQAYVSQSRNARSLIRPGNMGDFRVTQLHRALPLEDAKLACGDSRYAHTLDSFSLVHQVSFISFISLV